MYIIIVMAIILQLVQSWIHFSKAVGKNDGEDETMTSPWVLNITVFECRSKFSFALFGLTY